jgi:hypothetical protein
MCMTMKVYLDMCSGKEDNLKLSYFRSNNIQEIISVDKIAKVECTVDHERKQCCKQNGKEHSHLGCGY